MSTSPSRFEHLTHLPLTTETRDHLAALIDGTEVFNDIEWGAIRTLVSYFDAYEAPANSIIFKEGDPGNFACFILEGRVDVYRENVHHERKTVISLGPGKFLGETSAFDEDARSASAITTKKTTILILPHENFIRLCHEEPALAINLLIKWARTLSQRLRRASGMLIEHND